MSANIYWRSLDAKHNLEMTSSQCFMEECKSVFGDFPIVLKRSHMPKIEVLAAIEEANECKHKPWSRIIKALKNNSVIKIWDVY